MKFIKQTDKLSIVNLDNVINPKTVLNQKKHGILLPNNFRSIVCGPSNSGKTNLIINLLVSPNGLYFKNLYVFSKSLYQIKYKFLQCILSDIPEIGYFPFAENEEVPHPNEIKTNSVMIFDDVSCEKQNNIRNYFTMGRHNNIDVFYLCQTYSYIPKQLIRDNANFIVLFKQDERNLRHIYSDHVNTDMSFNIFKQMCSTAWKQSNNAFVIIDKESEKNRGRYRFGFDTFVQV